MADLAERLRVTRAVMGALGYHDFRSHLADGNTRRAVSIVIALPDERMADFFVRLARTDSENVVLATLMPYQDHSYLELVLLHRAVTEPARAATDEDDCPVHGDTTVGMLLAYLRAHR